MCPEGVWGPRLRKQRENKLWGLRPHTFFSLLLRNLGPQTPLRTRILHSFDILYFSHGTWGWTQYLGVKACIVAELYVARDKLAVCMCGVISAELSHSVNSFGSPSKHSEICPESFGVDVCWFAGAVPDILGLLWPSLRPKSGSKSKISGRILQSFRSHFSQPRH